MGVRRFEELRCFQLAEELKRRVYAITSAPPTSHDRKFCDQIRGSARSAPANIVEGFGRFSPAEFARFLAIARGSLMETQNHLRDGVDLKYFTAETRDELCAMAIRTVAAVTKLMSYLQRCRRPRSRT